MTFSILSILGSLSIYGFYTASRGQWELTPDGKYKKTGMIFKYWSLFWEQYRKTERVYYDHDQFHKKYSLISKVRPDLIPGKYVFNPLKRAFTAGLNKDIEEKDLFTIQDVLLCKVEWIEHGKAFVLYEEVPVYDWPEWVQKPISSCPPCMSSVYGTPIWLLFLKLQKDAFSWTNYPITGEISFGFIFLLTLVSIVSFLHKKLKF